MKRWFTPATLVVIVLIASVGVAALLAGQAMSAARSRQVVSEAMLREYAQLAAWEFSREARKDVERALMHALTGQAHPERHVGQQPGAPKPGVKSTGEGGCDCGKPLDVEHWFDIDRDGAIRSRAGTIPPATLDALTRHWPAEAGGTMEGSLTIRALSQDDDRVVALRWEPHVGLSGGQIGLVVRPTALQSILASTHRRAAILPPVLAAGGDARALVDLRVTDARGGAVFVSAGTTTGPQPIDAELLAGTGLRLRSSMTPAFVAGLGPEHGAGPGHALVVGLVVLNVLMVAVGLWQVARERELARLRADFVAGVSHELRTPLTQIRMFAETLLLDRIRNPAEGRRALEIIGQETRRLGQLVENVLYFHRHRRAPLALPTEPFDLAGLVREVGDGFAPLAASRRAHLDVRTPAREVAVHASPDGMRQVLLNLLDNAVKFGPAGQTVHVDLDLCAGEARLAVEDRGPGVPPADRRRIFQAFERGRTTNGAGGAGIGLAVVQQLVHAHGGRVAVEQGRESGARFIVFLPVAAVRHESTAMSLAG